VSDEILRTPDEWLTIKKPGWTIADPDGWRMKDAPAYDEPISEREFGWRFNVCTVRAPRCESWQILWRCTTCGKWSHAKRRPTSHKRTVCLRPASQCPVPCGNCGGGCGGAEPGEYVEVACGPFEKWTATRAAE
jgi:hypothetical protein